MRNEQIAEALEEVADLLEFQGANAFRLRAYRQGARAIRDLEVSLEELSQTGAEHLTGIAGIGKDLATKCHELATTGKLKQLEALRGEIPNSALALLRIPGLGPKKAATLHKELGIQDLEQLRAACVEGTVARLKGFGQATQQNILEGIDFAASTEERIRWADAEPLVESLISHLRGTMSDLQITPAGSYRRGRETVGDLDLLVVSDDAESVMRRFADYPGLERELARGPTKMSVRARPGIQIDLRIVPATSFGAALQYFTGSKEHNVQLRSRGKDLGLKINEYGVYRSAESGEPETSIAGETEESVYHALGLDWIPPESREGRDEIELAAAHALPRLVELSDLRGDLHLHTVATDGQGTLEEMVEAAKQAGLEYIAVTDHSRRVTMARGLDPDRLRAQWKEIDAWNGRQSGPFVVLKGIECDILEQGGMDLPDDVLAEADWVVASVHYGQNQSRAQITDRVLGAIRNPHVSAIAHPTGRLINRRPAYEIALEEVIQAAFEEHKFLELNANPWRLDLNDVHCARAKARGVPIVINSDAHSTDGIQVLRHGVRQARRGGLTAEDVANTRSWSDVRKLLGKG